MRKLLFILFLIIIFLLYLNNLLIFNKLLADTEFIKDIPE
jgi:hypothetical protein